ncbi:MULTISPECIES: hypothetical protein [Streptomyces]|uniref:Uncharacterized protein n=1 Tax=Streptomyces sanyensis TaxID=568869 RepID=A0ABP9AL88_9ACTN
MPASERAAQSRRPSAPADGPRPATVPSMHDLLASCAAATAVSTPPRPATGLSTPPRGATPAREEPGTRRDAA